jgi:peptidoglycan hydrolase CwlO-like protein
MIQIAAIPAQSTTGAILEIIALLIIAGFIAWLTAYFYYRSIYRKKKAELESIIHTRDEMISYLEKEKSNLLLKITELEKEIESQKAEIHKLQAIINQKNEKNNEP